LGEGGERERQKLLEISPSVNNE